MKHRFLKHTLLLLTFVITPSALLADRVEQVSSPNGNLTVTAGTDDSGHPYYKLSRGRQEIITRSALGYLLTESINDFLDNDFDVSFSNISEKDETVAPTMGRRRCCSESLQRVNHASSAQRWLTNQVGCCLPCI